MGETKNKELKLMNKNTEPIKRVKGQKFILQSDLWGWQVSDSEQEFEGQEPPPAPDVTNGESPQMLQEL